MHNYESTTPESEKDLAQTPPWFIESLCNLLGITCFDLDVCANEATAKAIYYYSLQERNQNCLSLPWKNWNYCNPPFSDALPFLERSVSMAKLKGSSTAGLIPNKPETKYTRYAKQHADTIIEMPFRLKFLRPDGSMFVDSKGKEQSPQFSCLVAIFTPLGLKRETAYMYHDFRIGFMEK